MELKSVEESHKLAKLEKGEPGLGHNGQNGPGGDRLLEERLQAIED